MAVYEINGARYELPDDLEGEQLTESLMQLSSMTQESPAQPGYQPFGQIKEDIDPADLATDPDWLRASREVYAMNEGKPWEGDDKDLAEWGLDYMGWFNYNIPKMGLEAKQLETAQQPQKEAFLHLMDQFDATEYSWAGTGRFFKGVLADPTTYLGLSTLGLGFLGKEGVKQASKVGVREMLRSGVRTGVTAGAEGAIYGATESALRQSAEVSAGRREEIDGGAVAVSAGVGAVAGLVGGTALDVAATSIAKKFSRRAAPDVTSQPTAKAADDVAQAQPAAAQAVPPGATPESPAGSLPEAPVARPAEPPVAQGDLFSVEAPAAREAAQRSSDETVLNRSMDNLRMPRENNAIPFVPRNMQEVTRFARDLADDLRELHYTQAEDIARALQTRQMTQAEYASFNRSTQLAVDQIKTELASTIQRLNTTKDPQEITQLIQKQQELEALVGPTAMMDEALSSLTGSMLRQRQEGLTELRGVTPESIMREEGKTKPEADIEFAKRVEQARASKAARQTEREYDQRIALARAKGDNAEATRLTVEKQMELDAFAEGAAGAEPGWMRKYVELSISNVFSSTTLMINMVPSMAKVLYRPVLKTILNNPFEAATQRELLATYSAMASATRGAAKAAKAAFKYEQSILTHDAMRMMDGELALKGRTGAIIRIFPRLLNASDEFMSRLAYDGFVAGRAAGLAYEEGLAKGMSGRELDKFVKESTKGAVEKAYDTADLEGQISILARKGKNLGHTGEALRDYVVKGLRESGDALSSGNDQEAIGFVREVLYKTAFNQPKPRKETNSGFFKALDAYEDGAGFLGTKYEEAVNRVPLLRVLGQLFLRTPLRVFEEGLRLTPGVQFVTPGFINDLAGRHGRLAQVRAQGEAMLSMGFMGAVLTGYAQGRLTGDGAYEHWKQQRNRTDSDLSEPYTWTFDDGSTWSFRSFDPLATPVKIIVNGLERWERLEMRRQQGEYISADETDRALAAIAVGTGAIATAIRDANLMSGLDGALDLATNLSDPEARDGAMVKFLGDKLRTLVPNTLHKMAKWSDPSVSDPATFWQTVEARLASSVPGLDTGIVVPKSYDVLGNVRTINDKGAMWGIFSESTYEERRKGKSEEELNVLRKLDYVSKVTGETFATPTKHRLLGNTDLRKSLTADGKETLYDRWQRYYKEFQPEMGLSAILDAGIPVGTTSISAATVQETRSYINTLRDAAFARLMAEESQVTEDVINRFIRKGEVEAGFWDQ